MFKKFFQQTRKPEGFGGKVMIGMMNSGHAKLAEWAFKFIKYEKDYNVLDIGCGGGSNLKRWLDRCNNGFVTGIDYSIESVNRSIKFNKEAIDNDRCKVVEGNVIAMHFEENSFDVVSAFETVYFWPEIQTSFINVNKILKPKGRFLIINEACDDRSKKWEDIISGMKVYKEEELVKLLENANFKIKTIKKPNKRPWLFIEAEKL